ncbi:MAG TPA: patatin-like phospholipase family protein [Oculatellaceae cyanobacterium]
MKLPTDEPQSDVFAQVALDERSPERPRRALVLSGGGARGAYEIGVVKAILERGVHFDLAFGTSIGGINAAFIAQGSFARLEDLWSSMKATDVFRMPTFSQLRHMVIGHRWGLLDTSPLEQLLFRELKLDRFLASAMKVGFLTTDLCTLETKITTTDEIDSLPHLVDVLMAASAVPILFPARDLNGEGMWIDSGLVRNTPIETAINMGAQEIYTVLVQAENDGSCPTNLMQVLTRCADILLYASARDGIRIVNEYNKALINHPSLNLENQRLGLKVFQPRDQVAQHLLDISPQGSRALIRQGYEDAQKQLDAEST